MTAATIASPRKMPWDADLTWADLQAMPDDGFQYEIIGGELYVMTAPIPVHQGLLTRLLVAIHNVSEARGIGRVYASPIGVELAEHDIVQPDLLFIAIDRVHIEKDDRIIGTPDIILEIFSPSTRSKDLKEKADLYARAGVPEYWTADPKERRFITNHLQGNQYVQVAPDTDGWISSPTLAGLRVNPADIFAELD